MIRWLLSTFFLALHWVRMVLRLRSRIIGAIKHAVLSVVVRTCTSRVLERLLIGCVDFATQWDRCVQLGLQLMLTLQPFINTMFRAMGRQPHDLSTWTRYESYVRFRHKLRAAKLRLSVISCVVTKVRLFWIYSACLVML
jgi:hypothetical protein